MPTLFKYLIDTCISDVSKLLKNFMKIQYNCMKHVSMYNTKTFSINEPKMKIVLFMNDFKKGMRLIVLFLYVNNRM